PEKSTYLSTKNIINQENAPILLSALKYCEYLITLDKHFIYENVKKYALQKQTNIMTPKKFISLHRKNNI
ncbi:MAG: hypothetical protein QGG82_02260, partial [Patescibacteria group bacterium]|nr:hypothetical protein [Patescibacteria group bacterium]